MAHNLKYNKKLRKKLEKEYGKIEYPRYDNYDAIEVPFVECIPSDYDGIMGVPMTLLKKKENPIVLYVHWDMMPTPNASTKKLRWMRIMLPPGARGARLTSKIARCSAEHIITPKETGDYL